MKEGVGTPHGAGGGTPSLSSGPDPHPPLFRKTGYHPPMVAPTNPPLRIEPRRSIHPGTAIKRGGGDPSHARRGTHPSTALQQEGGTPYPPVRDRRGYHPPPVARTQARLRVELRRCSFLTTGNMAGGWVPLVCPEGYPPLHGSGTRGGVPCPPIAEGEGGIPCRVLLLWCRQDA
jgi:hypothetical protein